MADLSMSIAANSVTMRAEQINTATQVKVMKKAMDTFEDTAQAVLSMLPVAQDPNLGANIDTYA